MDTPVSLSLHLTRAWEVFRRMWRVLAVGLVAAALLSMLMQMVVGERVGMESARQVRRILGEQRYQQVVAQIRLQTGGSGMDWRRLSERVGNEVSTKLATLGRTERQQLLTEVFREALRTLLPVLLLFIPLFLLLMAWTRAYFLAIALSPDIDAVGAVNRATRTFLPLTAVYGGMFLASLIWLPFFLFLLGAFFAPLIFFGVLAVAVPIILTPRLSLAPVLFMQGGGIVRSIEESYRRSRGFWWNIVSNMAVATLLAWLILWFFLSLTDIIGAILSGASIAFLFLYWLRQFLSLAASAYRTIFLADLAADVSRRSKRKK